MGGGEPLAGKSGRLHCRLTMSLLIAVAGQHELCACACVIIDKARGGETYGDGVVRW